MNEQTEKLLREIAAKIGTTGEHLWGVLIQQAYIRACECIGGIILILFLTFFTFRLLKRMLPNRKPDDSLESLGFTVAMNSAVWLIWSMFVVLGIFELLILTSVAINNFANPEFAALDYILHR